MYRWKKWTVTNMFLLCLQDVSGLARVVDTFLQVARVKWLRAGPLFFRVGASEPEVDDMLAEAIRRLGLDQGASEVTEAIQRLELEDREEDDNGEMAMDTDSD